MKRNLRMKTWMTTCHMRLFRFCGEGCSLLVFGKKSEKKTTRQCHYIFFYMKVGDWYKLCSECEEVKKSYATGKRSFRIIAFTFGL